MAMKTVVLISCVKTKLKEPAKVEDIYISDWFKSALIFAKFLKPDVIYVLSAKHGLLALNDVIEPYELTLKTMKSRDIKAWAIGVVEKLNLVSDLQHDRFVILAGEKYRKFLVSHLVHHEVPMAGLTSGKQLQFLKNQL